MEGNNVRLLVEGFGAGVVASLEASVALLLVLERFRRVGGRRHHLASLARMRGVDWSVKPEGRRDVVCPARSSLGATPSVYLGSGWRSEGGS